MDWKEKEQIYLDKLNEQMREIQTLRDFIARARSESELVYRGNDAMVLVQYWFMQDDAMPNVKVTGAAPVGEASALTQMLGMEDEMIEKKQLRIELTGAEAEKIVSDWVAARMIEHGYKLDYSRNEDGAWPDTFWRGEEVPNVELTGDGQLHRPASE